MNQKSLPTGHLRQVEGGGHQPPVGDISRRGGEGTGHTTHHRSPQAWRRGHSLAEGPAVPGVGADAVVLAVVAVAEGGAGGVPVRPGHAGEAGPAGEEHGAGVQRPLCRDGKGGDPRCATPITTTTPSPRRADSRGQPGRVR